MRFNTIPEALEDLRQGKIILVTDDPERENEGDFICAAEFATTENVNFMATHGKGLICMPMSEAFVQKLKFPQMVRHNTDNHETAFTVSIDHISTTTGISAAERSITALACVAEDAKAEDFRRPGHMFPLLARKNGVLERNGHTEATVDLCRLAGLKECGLCCEIMRDDGTMMRTEELAQLAERFQIKFITIQALQEYRKCHEKLVDQVAAVNLPTKYGDFRAYGFVSRLNGEHHIALVKGEIGDGRDVLCRVHSECLTGDTFGSLRCDCGQQLAAAMTQIEKEGRGILLYMRQEGRGLLYKFKRTISFINVSDLLLELFEIVFLMLFFFALAQTVARIDVKTVFWKIFAYGIPAAMFALMCFLPRFILMVTGKSELLNDHYGVSYSDLGAAAYIIYNLLSRAKAQTSEPEE